MCDVLKHVIRSSQTPGFCDRFYEKFIFDLRNWFRRQRKKLPAKYRQTTERLYTAFKIFRYSFRPFLGASALYFDIFKDITIAVMDAQLPDAELATGDHCRWCSAKAVCPKVQTEALEAFGGVVDVNTADLPDPKTLDADRIRAILDGGAKLVDWFNEVQKFAEGYMVSGGEIPGYKLVQKIGRRKWIAADEEVAAFMLMQGFEEDQVRPRKLITLTEAERLLKQSKAGKETLDALELNYTVKESSGVTMAPASDRREAVNVTAKAFEGVNL